MKDGAAMYDTNDKLDQQDHQYGMSLAYGYLNCEHGVVVFAMSLYDRYGWSTRNIITRDGIASGFSLGFVC